MIKIYRCSLLLLVFLICLVVSTNFVKHAFSNKIEYSQVTAIKTYDDVLSYGIFLRNEYIVINDKNDYVHIDVNNGSRVKKGQDIAITYNNHSFLEQSVEISRLRDKLYVIDSVATITSIISDNLKTSVQINSSIAEFNQNLDPNDLSSVNYNLTEIQNTALRGAYSQLSKTELSIEKEYIEKEIALKQAEIIGEMSTITADFTGTFVQMIDSYENIQNVTVDTITDIVNTGNRNFANNEVIGKIIIDNNWKFACVVDNDEVERILDATRPRLIFESMPSNEIDVTISEIIKEENQSIIIFEGKATNETILEMRSSDVQIVLRTYSGIKIPKQSTLVINDVLGIYILNGSQKKFKEIDPIFEKENYYIIKLVNSATNSDIIVGDKIVTSSWALTSSNFLS